MGESVAGDFVAFAVKRDDVIGTDSGPMARPFVDKSARDIERRPCMIRIENRDSGGDRAFGRIVERETDHRALVSQPKRRRAEMPGQAVADTPLQC
ncbi:hypothetical protein GALL_541690 [mine drainage metagenome]|uniref:Uncharacterized protein n=1 Tax=mine drainage metagenome TaxID=410659 RepID=A0A1J5P8Z8_9ZZZZ